MVKIERLPSGSYRARVHLGGGKYKSITGKDKKAVQLEAAQIEAGIKSAQQNDNGMTVEKALESYVESKKNVLSPKTYREYTQIRKNSLESLKNIRVDRLTQEQVQLAINSEAETHAPKTVRNAHGLLTSTLKMFRPDFVLRTTLPMREKNQIVIPTEEDMKALFVETYDTEIELPVLLGSISGLRMSEITGLRWSAIDFEKRTLTVCAAKVTDINNEQVMKTPKSRAGYRTAKLLPQVYDELKRLYDPDKEFVTDLPSYSIYNKYKFALKRCCPSKHYSFHELRHYAASVMIMLGIPIKYIADYLGHETEDMVNKVYGHIMADKQDEMFKRVEDYYNGVFGAINLKSATKSATKK